MFTFKIINDINKIENDWNDLILESNTTNIFINYFWVNNWVNSYQNFIHKLNIIVVFDNKKCIAICPFYIASISSNTLSLIGTNEPETCEVNAEGMDIIFLKDYRENLLSYLVNIIDNHLNTKCISMKNIIEDSLIHSIAKKLSGSKVSRQFPPCYQFIFDQFNNLESTLLTLKKNKRVLNKFINNEHCTFEIANSSACKELLFESLVKLHHNRWEAKGKRGVFDDKTFLNFHRSMLKDINFTKYVLLSAVKYKQEIISVNYSFHIDDTIYFYQAGINTTFKPNFSPGLLNHLLLIKYASGIDVNIYNLLLSNNTNTYKSGLSNNTVKLISIENYKYTFSNILKIIYLKLITNKYLRKLFN